MHMPPHLRPKGGWLVPVFCWLIHCPFVLSLFSHLSKIFKKLDGCFNILMRNTEKNQKTL